MDLVALHRIIDEYFDLDEFQTLCFEVGVAYDDLGGVGQAGKARELIMFLDRRDRAKELLPIIARERPHLDLSSLAPSAKPTPAAQPPAVNASRIRPVTGGNSISHFRGGAATLGCLVIDRDPPHHVYLLCDASGLAPFSLNPRAGDPIIQPGKGDGGRLPNDVIATLSRWTAPTDDPMLAENNVSAAVADVRNFEDVSPEIVGRGLIQGVRNASPGMSVFGVGRSSGQIAAQVEQIDAMIELRWPVGQIKDPQSTGDSSGQLSILFADLIACGRMMASGDSGMVLLDGDNYALGLGFAGNASQSLFIPMQRVLDALSVELVTEKVWAKLTEQPD